MLSEENLNPATNPNKESLMKNKANKEVHGLEEKITRPDNDNLREEQVQSEWEIEEKRIQETRQYKQTTAVSEPGPVVEDVKAVTDQSPDSSEISSVSLLETVSDAEVNSRVSFEEFTDERILVSHNALGNKQMKIKVLEVSDEIPPVKWKFGDRVKVTKILVTIKHLATQEVEEGEFDIEAIERELQEKRHYTSTNRWIPANDIKNGYVAGSKHTRLISDASALDYIVF